jgi:hypothetical protein
LSFIAPDSVATLDLLQNFQDACIDGDALSKMRDMALSHEAGGMPVFLALCKDELGMSRVGHVLKLARKLQELGL